MNWELLITLSVVGLLALIGLIIFLIRRPKKLKVNRFVASWRELQGLCKDKASWSEAVIQADKLLDVALKKRKLKGKSMGERLVSAQRLFTDNDDTWFAHNLAKKLSTHSDTSLKESDVRDALLGFRQALRDLGALPAADKEASNAK